jgi:hypothetical protein
LKNKIARSLRNDEVRAYMLHGNAASSQATTDSKTCQIKRFPINKLITWRGEKSDKKVVGKKTKKNPKSQSAHLGAFAPCASLAGGCKLNIMDFLCRLVNFFHRYFMQG